MLSSQLYQNAGLYGMFKSNMSASKSLCVPASMSSLATPLESSSTFGGEAAMSGTASNQQPHRCLAGAFPGQDRLLAAARRQH